jgi:disease resistance protein RPS2
MADLVSGALVGALMDALLTEVIDLAKKAWRCKKNCKNLVSTLNSVSPLVHKVGESSDSGDAACQAWLKDFENLLNEARHITRECIMKKTLIAKMVHNDADIQEKYRVHSILWNTIGSDAKIHDLYQMMGKSLNNGGIFERDYACRNEEDQRTYLIEAFRKKKVLLILDDVWEKYWHGHSVMEWLDIVKGPGSVTLVTTRSQNVLSCAKAKEIVEVPLLSNEEGLKLFYYHAFRTNSLPSGKLGEIAKEMSKECAGLPLALEVIGSTMWEKEDISYWKIALKRLKQSDELCNSTSIEEKLFWRLRFSYDELDDIQKKCFLYFAAFPEDYRISTHELYSIWHAEQLFDYCNDEEETQDMGRNHLIGLADQSLIKLLEDGRVATIYDVLRDLAIHIICEALSTWKRVENNSKIQRQYEKDIIHW